MRTNIRKNFYQWLLHICNVSLIILVFCFYGCSGDDNNASSPSNSNYKDPTAKKIKENNDITYKLGDVTFKMKFVEGGKFKMGAQNVDNSKDNYDSEADLNEAPVHDVTVNKFYMGEVEITQKLWREVMKDNTNGIVLEPSEDDGLNKPVTNISWFELVVFCNRLSLKVGEEPVYSLYGSTDIDTWGKCTDNMDAWNNIKMNTKAKGFRMPTEAEWEFAARGGKNPSGFKYSGGNSIGKVAWYAENSDNVMHNVSTKAYNELWLYDMSGNVWEWCWDAYGDYKSNGVSNPTGAETGSAHVARGGCFNSNSASCRVTVRGYSEANLKTSICGGRLVLVQ